MKEQIIVTLEIEGETQQAIADAAFYTSWALFDAFGSGKPAAIVSIKGPDKPVTD